MLNWKKDIAEQPIETMLLFEKRQLLYLSGYNLRDELAAVFNAKPYIEWFIRNKAPELNEWLDLLKDEFAHMSVPTGNELRNIESKIMCSLEDWVIYVTEPDDYDNQPFVAWDENELTGITDFNGKIVVDIGSGTGKQAFAAAKFAKYVYCVEPVGNLRSYLKEKAKRNSFNNVFVTDGLLEDIPFHDGFTDIATCGHVFGDMPKEQISELERIVKPAGTVILCPGNIDSDNKMHTFLLNRGYSFSSFLEPGEGTGSGWKRKYWKTV